ncbi:TPA: BrnT family toxin [Candidatus Poribacteria bacterium]|nr:BrnT family toxin [Candidatus Poribacteria bacterium]
MQINRVIIPDTIAEKIERKHNVSEQEAKEIFFNEEAPLFVRRSQRVRGRYLAYGRAYSGRYIVAAYIPLKGGNVKVITARDMNRNERRAYERRGK